MGEQLTEEQISELKEAFSLFDKDGDGLVNLEDLDASLRSIGYCPAGMGDWDVGGKGALNLPEFLTMMARKMKDVTDEEAMRTSFNFYDKDGDGFITSNELQVFLTSLGKDFTQEELDEMIREADTDGDGKVSFEEFENMMMIE